jgi:hypothetical protein
MKHRRTTFVIGLACCLVLAGAAVARQAKLSLSGRIVLESSPGQKPPPLPRFTARLYAPKEMKRPTIVTYTDAAGNFKVNGLDAGRYLLEIYQNSEMVYQKVLALDERMPQPLVITLRPR